MDNLTARKIGLALIRMIAILLLIEMSARTYHSIKYKDPSVFLYGRNFIRNIIIELRESRLQAKAEPAKKGDFADLAFEGRAMRGVPLKIKSPESVSAFGQLMRFNKYGFRNPDIEVQKEPGVTRLIAFGESFVLCPGVEENLTWEHLLADKLKRAPGKYEVINAGSGGNNINQNLITLVDVIVKFSTDYLIFFSAHNNHSLIDYKKERSLSWKVSNFFYNISQFYAMVRERSALKTFKDNNYFLYNYDVRVTKSKVDLLMALYRKRLLQIDTICRENGIKIIFGLQPEFIPGGLKGLQDLLDEDRVASIGKKLERQGYLSYYEFEYYMQGRFNLEMRDLAGTSGSLLFDGTKAFPEDKYPYFIDQIHLSAAGSAVFSDALYSFLISEVFRK